MIVLDTHAWVWWADNPRQLSARARRAIEAEDEVGVAAISCFEIALLVSKGRLQFDRDVRLWLRQALAQPKHGLLALVPEIAVQAANLEWNHRDPADRLIVATALFHRAPLISKDERMRSYSVANVIW